MSLFGGDLTTPARFINWSGSSLTLPSAQISQLITSQTAMLYGKLNRSRLYSQTFTRIFDGVGNMQIELPDWPVTSVVAVQQGSSLVQPALLLPPPAASTYFGYRFVPWNGNLPGDPSVLEFVNGYFYVGAQNVRITYQAGYLVVNEAQAVPAGPGPYTVTVAQLQGIWCRDNGVVYASTGLPLVPVATTPSIGQYIPPLDANNTPADQVGVYTFAAADADAALLISYSFVPAELEEACNQMVAERLSYTSRIGEISKSLGGQETVRFLRGGTGRPYSRTSALPPEVADLIWPYVSVIPPAIGAPV